MIAMKKIHRKALNSLVAKSLSRTVRLSSELLQVFDLDRKIVDSRVVRAPHDDDGDDDSIFSLGKFSELRKFSLFFLCLKSDFELDVCLFRQIVKKGVCLVVAITITFEVWKAHLNQSVHLK